MKKKLVVASAIGLLMGITACSESELLQEIPSSQAKMGEIMVTATIGENSATRVTVTPDSQDITESTWVSAWEGTDKLGAWTEGANKQLSFAIVDGSFATTSEEIRTNKTPPSWAVCPRQLPRYALSIPMMAGWIYPAKQTTPSLSPHSCLMPISLSTTMAETDRW